MFNKTSLFRIMAEVGLHHDLGRTRRDVIDLFIVRHGVEDVTILTQDAVLSTFNRILGALTAALAGIAAISLTVAGIGIMNVMLVSVSERTREIGLLKALGATRRQILGLFLLEASIISTAGGVLGLAGSFAVGQVIARLAPDFPIQPPVWAVAVALLVSGSVGLLFGGTAARRAAFLDPVEALMRLRA
jgi:putative ABC transport system permease protein